MGLKKIARKCAGFINRFPFINKISKHRAKVVFNGTLLVGCKIKCRGKNNKIIFNGNGGVKNTSIVINGDNNTVFLESGVSMDGGAILLDGNGNEFIARKDTKFCGKIHIACIEGTKVSVGEKSLFSSDITIRTGDSHSVVDMEGNRINPSKDVVIGNHVWVGNHVIITKGVCIPDNCIIGTGAVVTSVFEKTNSVIAGVPAKITKENINWRPERI